MRNRSSLSALRIISILFILSAIVLTVTQLIQYSRNRALLPTGLIVAGVDVGGLSREEAAQRLLESYSIPVGLTFKSEPIHLYPSAVDFQPDVESMLAAADLVRTEEPFWEGFINFLWGRSPETSEIPLSAKYSEDRLRDFLEEISIRYDQPAIAALPIAGSVNFSPGQPGLSLDVDGSILLIENAIYSLHNRNVELPLTSINPTRPDFKNLDILLQQTLEIADFEGIAGVYLLELDNQQEIHTAYQNFEKINNEPDIAFTASSIIKVPIMVSSFRRLSYESDPEATKLMEDMITKSGNEAADWLMDRTIDQFRGPLFVTEDMQSLGLENTFLAGYFSLGSPLLDVIETPSNSRQDINTDPDPYSQTTTSDIGMLLEDIYQCANYGGSALQAVFPGEITQDECQEMISLLIDNRLPMLLTAGLPEGTQIAHKHGWVTTNGVIRTIGDAGIIYTLGGDYILVIFLHNPEQLIWDDASLLIAELSRAVYNYFNLPVQ